MYCHTSIDSMDMNIRPNYYLFSPKLAFSLFVIIVIQFMSKVKRNVENLDAWVSWTSKSAIAATIALLKC